MSILKRTIIMVFCTCLVALTLVFYISDVVYLQGYDKLEISQVIRNVNRVNEAVAVRLEALNTFCYDWAAWDDTYDFAQEYKQEFVDRNLQDETFISSKINFISVINSSGKIVFAKALDLFNSEEIVLPDNLAGVLAAEGLVNPVGAADGISGLMLFSGQPMLIVSRPVLTSTAEGPSTGSVIMGRFLDAEVIRSLTATTHFSINVLPVTAAGANPEYDSVSRSLDESGSIYVKPQNNKMISGYTFITSLSGNTLGIFEVEIPRDIHAQGIKTTAVMHSSILFVAILFCGLFVLLIRKSILSRVTVLGNSVKKIGAQGNASSRIAVSGNDELSILTGNINGMLDSLEKSELKRRSMKELMSHILTNTLNAIVAVDQSGNIILTNKTFNTLFGLDETNVTSQNIFNLPSLGEINSAVRAFLNGSSLACKTEIQCRNNGMNKTFIANFARMSEETQSFIILTDVTEERVNQERMYITDRLASVGEMASGIAHELNNPLTGILGLSAILAEENTPADIKEDIIVIRNEAQRAAGIVKNMLSFARKHVPRKDFAQVNKIIEDVLKLRSYEHRVNNVIVEKQLDRDLPEILMDYFQVQQVFINIILNAEQAMTEMQNERNIRIITEKVDNIIRTTITNNGPGIPPQNLKRIFDPFFTTKEVGKGTGLGLSISYGIITAHGGTLKVRNEVGNGVSFIIELPFLTNTIEEILESVEQCT